METDREGDCEGQSKLTVQFGWQITLPVIRSPTHPPLPEQSLRCVWSICWTYLHQRNTWILTFFHWSQNSQYNLGDKSHYLWSALQPTHPCQIKAWDVSGLSAGPTSINVTPGLWHLSTSLQSKQSHYLWSALQPTHPCQNKAWNVSACLSAGPTSINVTPGLWRFSTGVSVCVTGLAGALVAWVFINTVLVAVGIILAFVDICTSPHYQVSTMS